MNSSAQWVSTRATRAVVTVMSVLLAATAWSEQRPSVPLAIFALDHSLYHISLNLVRFTTINLEFVTSSKRDYEQKKLLFHLLFLPKKNTAIIFNPKKHLQINTLKTLP